MSDAGPPRTGVSACRARRGGAQEFTVVDPAGVHTACGSGCPVLTTSPTALLAVAMLDAVGVSPEQAAPGLRAAAVPGRLEPVDRGQDFLAVVDYAHKPGALRAVLETLRGQGTRPVGGGVRRRRQPRSGQARADGSRSPPNWPTWWWSPTTIRATRNRR